MRRPVTVSLVLGRIAVVFTLWLVLLLGVDVGLGEDELEDAGSEDTSDAWLEVALLEVALLPKTPPTTAPTITARTTKPPINKYSFLRSPFSLRTGGCGASSFELYAP